MKLARTTLARLVVVALLAGGLVAVLPGPAKAQLTLRRCTSDTGQDIISGDGVRKLSVCSRGWVNGNPASQTRGVVEMHTYARAFNGVWVDSRSQSITIERAEVRWYDGTNWEFSLEWGQDVYGGGNCRVNGPNGSVGCSVPNTVAVDFYSAGIDAPVGDGTPWHNSAYTVSWRDDRGVAHPHVYIQLGADNHNLVSPTWYA
jgi:hypothetical protein